MKSRKTRRSKRSKKVRKTRRSKKKNHFSSVSMPTPNNNSLFSKIHDHIKHIFNLDKNLKHLKFDFHNEVKNIHKDDLKRERIDYISNFHVKEESFIKKLFINRNCTISDRRTINTVGSINYNGYNFVHGKLSKAANGVALGTWINNNDCKTSLVNIYKTTLSINGIDIDSIRLGTAARCKENTDIKKVLQIIEPKKKIINFSLLSHCLGSCNLTSSLIGRGPIKKIKETLVYEPIIVDAEEKLNDSDFVTVFYPMASRKNFKILDINNPKQIKDKNENICLVSKVCDPRIKKLVQIIDLNDPYKSIIKAFIYYFLFLKKDYVINLKCRSGKDRSSAFDCILKSVMTSMILLNPSGSIDQIYDKIIDDVEKWIPEYLKIGFVITYYSTGLYGLKMKDLHILKDIKRILGSSYDDFLGLQKFIK